MLYLPRAGRRARNLAQLEDSLAALDLAMTPELRTEISGLSPTPPSAHDR